MRILALLILAMSAIFLSSSSLNGGFWSWLSTAPLLTRSFAFAIAALGVSICSINAVGIRPRDLNERAWRNIGFLATTAACAILMITMSMAAIQTSSVPDWLPISGLAMLLIGGSGWAQFYLKRDESINAG